jgi:hypothetical protein
MRSSIAHVAMLNTHMITHGQCLARLEQIVLPADGPQMPPAMMVATSAIPSQEATIKLGGMHARNGTTMMMKSRLKMRTTTTYSKGADAVAAGIVAAAKVGTPTPTMIGTLTDTSSDNAETSIIMAGHVLVTGGMYTTVWNDVEVAALAVGTWRPMNFKGAMFGTPVGVVVMTSMTGIEEKMDEVVVIISKTKLDGQRSIVLRSTMNQNCFSGSTCVKHTSAGCEHLKKIGCGLLPYTWKERHSSGTMALNETTTWCHGCVLPSTST